MRPLISLVAFVLVLTACSAAAREKALSGTLLAVNAARDGFVAYDAEAQSQILDAADSREDYNAKVTAYRKRRESVVSAFEVAYRALAIAAMSKEPRTLALALSAAEQIKRVVGEFRSTGGDQ